MILLTLTLLFGAQTHSIQGRVTTAYGRSVPHQVLRVQANACAPNFQFAPVYEYYGQTNSFGYYNIRPRSDCGSYSVRILGARRSFSFTPQGYYWLFPFTDLRPRQLRGFDFYIDSS